MRSRLAFGLALFGCAAWLSGFCSAAAPAADATDRIVTVTLTGSGKARWSIDSSSDKGQLALSYSWFGSLRFAVPARVLQDPVHAKFAVGTSATLTGSWVGELTGRKLSEPDLGPYHCDYRGTNVPARVNAQLTSGTTRGTYWIVLHPRSERGFFPAKGGGATASCKTPVGDGGPTHFEPPWLFRDTLTDHGRFTSTTAVIVVSNKLLPRGSLTVRFPDEVGERTSPYTGNLRWSNLGHLVLRAR